MIVVYTLHNAYIEQFKFLRVVCAQTRPKNPQKYMIKHIFFLAQTTRRKIFSRIFSWISNSKFSKFVQNLHRAIYWATKVAQYAIRRHPDGSVCDAELSLDASVYSSVSYHSNWLWFQTWPCMMKYTRCVMNMTAGVALQGLEGWQGLKGDLAHPPILTAPLMWN